MPTDPFPNEEQVREALRQAKGQKAVAADLLGINRMKLWRRCRDFGIPSHYGLPLESVIDQRPAA